MSLSRSFAVAKHELRILRRDPVFLFTFTTMPLVVMAFIKPAFRAMVASHIGAGANGAEQAVPGVTVMFGLFLIGNVGFAFFREYGWGTWERVRAGWATPTEVMAGKVFVPMLQSALQLAVLFGIGGLIYGLHVRGSLVALAVVAAAFCISLVSLGLALLALCRTIMQLNALSNLGAMVLAGIGGALAPAATLPGWAKAIAPATPSYWAMRGFTDIVVGGAGLARVAEPVLVLAAFTAGFLAVAAFRFRYDDTKISFA